MHKQGPPSSQHHLARSCLLSGPCPELLNRVWGQDVVRRYKETHSSFDDFGSKVVFQLNDTHPTLAVPELMRLLMDEQGLGWTRSWELCSKVPAQIALQYGVKTLQLVGRDGPSPGISASGACPDGPAT